MITELKLENRKSYQKATIHIDPLSVLIGTNASGKSNALDALLLLNRLSTGAMITGALKGESGQVALRGGVEWAARKPGDTFTLGVLVRHDEITDFEYKLQCVVNANRVDVDSEELARIKYRTNKAGQRTSTSGTIKLFRTDHAGRDSPTIIAGLYNEKQVRPDS